MASVAPWSRDLLRSVGRLVAAVDVGLGGFDHPAIHQHSSWDLKWVPELRRLCLPLPPRHRYLAERLLDDFEQRVLPRLPGLPESAIHNDGNADNILLQTVDAAQRATGLIDFGDLVYTQRIFGLAIAAAYAMLKQPDPLAAAEEICAGYHQVLPVSALDLDVLFTCIQCRLVTSVVIVADELRQRRALGLPEDPYLVVNRRPGWQALERLADMPAEVARGRLARACGQ
jgi:Ser/Thr protein kinase RdoA (MazF antagonist)